MTLTADVLEHQKYINYYRCPQIMWNIYLKLCTKFHIISCSRYKDIKKYIFRNLFTVYRITPKEIAQRKISLLRLKLIGRLNRIASCKRMDTNFILSSEIFVN